MPPPMSEKQIKLDRFPVHIDMFGHTLAVLCADGSLIVADCLDHQNARKVENFVEVDRVIMLRAFKTDLTSDKITICLVKQLESEHELSLYKLSPKDHSFEIQPFNTLTR